ncbi:MAG: hypothetical protein ACKOBW_01510, partial [Planctomycetota bacterium]
LSARTAGQVTAATTAATAEKAGGDKAGGDKAGAGKAASVTSPASSPVEVSATTASVPRD